jgi:hypothetical protein
MHIVAPSQYGANPFDLFALSQATAMEAGFSV